MTLFGRTARFDANAVIDAVVDHPACAGFITGKLHRFFLGTDPSAERSEQLTKLFREAELDIRTVVEDIVRHQSFLDPANRYARIRGPWSGGPRHRLRSVSRWSGPCCGTSTRCSFFPPNVAGWPDDHRWLNASPMLLRARAGRDNSRDSVVVDAPDHATWALERAAIYDADAATLDAIRGAIDRVEGRRNKASLALSLAVCAPEFVLA